MGARNLDFRLLFEESPDVLLVLLPDAPRFTMVAATRARHLATNTTPEQVEGKGLFELFPDNPDDTNASGTSNLRASLDRVLATRKPDTMAVQKYDIRGPNGEFVAKYWSPKNIPILSASGHVRYILHRVEDVTELVRASDLGAELRDRAGAMEREVLARSHELSQANAELRAANTKLAELDAAKTAFFGNVSHEFRTPLTLMLGPLEDELAETNAPLSFPRRERLERVHRNSLRLLKLVNTLLDFARIEAGRSQAIFEAVDLSACTAEIASMFRAAIERAGLTLKVEAPTLAEPVFVDRGMWEKIVSNLLSNALKHTFEGTITVSVRRLGGEAEISVRDTGVGIAGDQIPRLFDRFHRIESARSRSHEGSGIGLALVRELVALHGGSVICESEPARGTEFRVRLQLGSGHLPPDYAGSKRAADGAATPASAYVHEAMQWLAATPIDAHGNASPAPLTESATRERVLWADDNADMREYVRSLLRSRYDVTAVADGRAALEAALSDPPDLILSDVMMPGLDGFELIREVRADERTRRIPVILLSARAGEEARVEGLERGADDYVVKPFAAKELLARIQTHIALARTRDSWTASLKEANESLKGALDAAETAKAEALRAGQAKAAFLSAMSHEIRTPMNAVIGFTTLLADTPLTKGQADFVESIQTSGTHLLGVIDDILDYSKLESGHFELARAPFNVRRTVETALSLVAPRASEKGVELAYTIEDGVPVACVADEARVRQVLVNYLSNAVKFTERGEVIVQVRARNVESRWEFEFSVRDTGIGISRKGMRRLFQEFSQLDSTVARQYGGTGLGLAISKALVELHGGTVWAESEPGKGSVFHFTISAEASDAPDGNPQENKSAPLGGKRVLLVDDNATNLEILRNQLEACGMFVRATTEPLKALGWVQRGDPFDLGILDHHMPEMDGVELATGIRSALGAAGVPLVLLTSLGASTELARRANAAFVAILTKPIRQTALLSCLGEILGSVSHERLAPPSSNDRPTSTKNVLLVEDNAVNQKLATAVLARLGVKPDVASDGAAAITAVEKKQYDVVLMDVQMPVMDGLTATREIRSRRSLVQPRIIAMTASALEEDRRACLDAGMNDYIAKPFDHRRLAELLNAPPIAPSSGRIAVHQEVAREIDPAALDELSATVGNEALVAIIDLFTRDANDLLGALRKAFAREDPARVLRTAHTLKSTATTLGAARLAAAAAELEILMRHGDVASAGAVIDCVVSSLQRVLAELAPERESRAPRRN